MAYAYAPAPGLADEDAPLWRDAPRTYLPVVAALEELERRTTAAGGLVLRFGHLTGPGSSWPSGCPRTRHGSARPGPGGCRPYSPG
ncbi:hypothetical protein ITP53_45180 [Nonomuraea sp. K274]|uniref:Uncharacterized protein n=1 Tax=Nonomuraea cypriaca TaxID=1187855 RepID=A0A931F643_9ACTN|nr:hypothetical protein [Nonomuraea cypriaca]MBF8192756.1 hypothetical protein [Nonomuraea cypriaca]